MDHFLLQNWPAWWQNSGLAFANSAFNSFEKNALANFWRDIGNFITGVGAGWAQRAIRFSVGIFAVTSALPPKVQQSALCQ